MRISVVWHLEVLVAVMMGTAHSSEIADLYSSIDLADVALEGDVADMALRMIEAKPLVRSNTTDAAKKSSFTEGSAALAMLMTILLRRRR